MDSMDDAIAVIGRVEKLQSEHDKAMFDALEMLLKNNATETGNMVGKAVQNLAKAMR